MQIENRQDNFFWELAWRTTAMVGIVAVAAEYFPTPLYYATLAALSFAGAKFVANTCEGDPRIKMITEACFQRLFQNENPE